MLAAGKVSMEKLDSPSSTRRPASPAPRGSWLSSYRFLGGDCTSTGAAPAAPAAGVVVGAPSERARVVAPEQRRAQAIRLAVLLFVAPTSGGCAAALDTRDRPEAMIRLSCEARSNAETTTLRATLTSLEATPPSAERLDLAVADRLFIRSGDDRAGLSRSTESLHVAADGESTTHAYEAAVATGSRLELGFSRGESSARWTEVPLPTAPWLRLTTAGNRLSWQSSHVPAATRQESFEIFVACDDEPALPPVDIDGDGPERLSGTSRVARYKPPRDDGGIDVDELLLLAKAGPSYMKAGDWSQCRKLLVVVARSSTIATPRTVFGEGRCFVESSRSIALPLPLPLPGVRAGASKSPP